MSWTAINHNTWAFDDNGVRFFLLTGSREALLIDSGMHTENALELARELTELPITLFNTHCDIDHIGGNRAFRKIMLAPSELVNYRFPITSDKIIPVYDGDRLDLGERPLKVIYIPGHTPGSVGLLDVEEGMFFSGDPVQDGEIFLFGPMRNLAGYILGLRRLQTFEEEIKSIYPSHGTMPLDTSIIQKLIDGAMQVERSELSPCGRREMFGNQVDVYDIGVAKLLCGAKE